jgi:small-conductance mechanosensitive channel
VAAHTACVAAFGFPPNACATKCATSCLSVDQVASFDRINSLLYRTCIGVWVFCLAFILLLVWGVSLTLMIIPFFTVFGTIVLVMGRAPGDMVSGAIYTLFLRPFDIGDRITISQPGQKPILFSLLVREIDVIRTHFLTTSGELLLIENHILRDMSIVNLSRSGPLTLLIEVKVSVTTPPAKMTELVDGIKLYAAQKDSDWTGIEPLFSNTDFEAGHLNLDIWASSKHAAADVGLVNNAKSLLILFIHAYMHSANIEFIKPLVPVKLTTEHLAEPAATPASVLGSLFRGGSQA